jgi:3-methylfumaryl-CoA hydratase
MDIANLRQGIGREEVGSEDVSVELVRRFEATFDRAVDPQPGDQAPLLIHQCVAPAAQPMSALGRDGHPAKGGFLPPVPLPRRMWAGGSFTFVDDIRVGDSVTRRSIIRDVVAKTGRSGPLVFVVVEHQITASGRAVLTERQDIVFRGEANEVAPKPVAETAPHGEHQRRLMPTPTLLFRYSALTFNGHRIHYDAPYARQVEGYPGLVVHGPLLATLLCTFAADLAGRQLRCFTFRSLCPVFDGAEIRLHANSDSTELRLWAARPDGPVAMEATATF